ncbi:MAG: beta-eliminating lyase-related protein [Proteobacteria bacterium]|jgi:threonine aldolase|nr:beta-eliminating lyase-related protein [Pseudomonadota bacterium]
MRIREFRSDTMTLPTEAMRDAMRDAELGDDVCDEDPTVNRLQRLAADRLGLEAALFVPSGTFGNQCAIGVHTRPSDEVIVAETAHVVDHEAGAAGALFGVQIRAVEPRRAPYLTVEDISKRVRIDDDVHHPRTRLVVLENALADGSVMPLEAMREVRAFTRGVGIAVHLDGARLFNAALALGVEAAALAVEVDSVMFCLSKGLGAPVGSLLCGPAAFVSEAKRLRKRMGGGMRQVGVLAAAGILALGDGVARLHEDHDNAKLLARLLAEISRVRVDAAQVHTNLVFCSVEETADRTMSGLVEFLGDLGIATYPPGWWGLRFATSSRVDADDVRALAAAVREYLG